MKRAALTIVMLMSASFTLAQQQAGGQKPAAPPAGSPAGAEQAARPAKRMPQAKTQPEFDAYKAAVAAGEFTAEEKAAAEKDPSQLESIKAKAALRTEKAADDFAAKYPQSELRVLLYKAAMGAYQNANDGDKMSAMGENVLKLDADDPVALVEIAEVLVNRTHATDLDKDERWARAQKYAQRALETVETDMVAPAGAPPQKIEADKSLLRSYAYSILGELAYNQDKFKDAEKYFQQSIDADPAHADPVVVLQLALSLDKQERYADALKEANHAVELTQDGTVAGNQSRQERNRLIQLTGGVPAPASQPPAAAPGAAPPPH